MKKLTLMAVAAAALLATASCKKDKDNGGNTPAFDGEGFYAVADVQSGDSKTGLNGLNVWWSVGDKITVFDDHNIKGEFGLSEGAGSPNGKFVKTGGSGDFNMSSASFYAFYTYKAPTPNGSNYKVSLPGTQLYANNSFDNGFNPMAAYSSSTTLQFHNLCGVMKLTLTSYGAARVDTITVKSNNSEDILWGNGTVTFGSGSTPTLDMDATPSAKYDQPRNEVILRCNANGTGVELNPDGVNFYVVLPAVAFTKGFTVTVHMSDKTKFTQTAPSNTQVNNSIAAGHIREMPAFAVKAYPKNVPMAAYAGGKYDDGHVGEFSIGPNEQVRFSKGNLQYIGSKVAPETPYWCFADNQYDVIGAAQNGNADNIDRDLFGWATSKGEDSDVTWINKFPWSVENVTTHDAANPTGYGMAISQDGYSWPDGSEYDWGRNPIEGAGNAGGLWRTLTKDEWVHLIDGRVNAGVVSYSYAKVTITDASSGGEKAVSMNGLLLFPDGFADEDYPSDLAYDTPAQGFQELSLSGFVNLEKNGVVFLPCAGYRDGTSVKNVGSYGYCWLSNVSNEGSAYNLLFSSTSVDPTRSASRKYGRLVRLVYFPVPATSVTLDNTTMVIGMGEVKRLRATLSPSNSTDAVTWTSSNTDVATVDNTGKVTPVSAGTTTITATTTSGKTATCTVKVVALKGFSVSATEKVHFSTGNLYWDGTDFGFEAEQCGTQPGSNGDWNSSHVSHFYWSASGGSARAEEYDWNGSEGDVFFTNQNGFTVNGQDGWFALSKSEWSCLLGNDRMVPGKSAYEWKEIDGKKGLCIYPDDYSGTGNETSFAALAEAGVVFLPAAGYFYYGGVQGVWSNGTYWSATPDGGGYAQYLRFYDGCADVYSYDRDNGGSVRLVRLSEN